MTVSKKRKNAIAAAVVAACIALAFALAGCAGLQSASSANVEAGTQDDAYSMDFVLDYTPNTNHTGIYAAEALGYYEEAGLNVRIVQPPEDGADALVASGNAQMGVTYQDFMANYLGSDDPLPVTAVAAIVQHNTSGIMSAAEAQIERPADMQGKRYATWDLPVEQAIVKSVVESDGGNFDEVELIPTGMTDEVSGLRADVFDAIWGYEGWGLKNAEVQGVDANYFSFRDIDERFDYYTPVIIANDAFLEADPEKVQAFLEATARGYAFAAQNPKEAADILLEAAPELDADLVYASQEFLSEQYIADAPYWGYMDPDRWNAFYAWMNEQGLTEEVIPLDTAFTNDYLPES